MKLTLENIETAVRKQFIWDKSEPKTTWCVNKVFNLGSKGLGATVFIGLATQYGFSLEQIEKHMDLEPLDIRAKLKSFQTRMQEMIQRRVSKKDLNLRDMTQLMYVKANMANSYLRLHYLKEYVSSAELNH